MNHCLLLDAWLAQLDTTGGLDGPALRQLSALVREYYVGAVASVSTYMGESRRAVCERVVKQLPPGAFDRLDEAPLERRW